MTNIWTAAAVADLEKMEHMSSTAIAAELSKNHPGIFTRNAVLGKRRRLKPRPSAPSPPPSAKSPPINHFTIFDLTHCSCRWPVAVPPTVNITLFCGCFTHELYCAKHTAIAFNR
jgi:hypothetical protein